ncbi:VanZ family protein [Chelativorans sp. J32]|uniref:VanZ family protein n=1 Tax=Chelativorans sp. J32 TaxID=935840 RepID=UPI0004BBE1DA|nr:VanZ family protein [Chelativorans sp. J32]
MRVTEETQIISGGFMRRRLAPKLLDWARMAAPFLILAIILYATLSPLNMRPRTQFPVHFEHFAAFAVLGALYAIAFPRRILLVLLAVVLAAAGLELLQLTLSDRHARFADFAVKLAGGIGGVTGTWLLLRLLNQRLARRWN